MSGAYVAVCNITGLFEYGAKESPLCVREGRSQLIPNEDMKDGEIDDLLPPVPGEVISMLQRASKLEEDSCSLWEKELKSRDSNTNSLSFSKRLAYEILSVALQRVGDSSVLPHIHVWLVFLAHVAKSESAISKLEDDLPWEHLVFMLNSFVGRFDKARFEGVEFPVPAGSPRRPLPEDYILRGLDWAEEYFPHRWFEDVQEIEEERSVEEEFMEDVRIERILWLATRVAAVRYPSIALLSHCLLTWRF